MEANELFQAAQALQYKEHNIGDALNVYQLLIDTYPDSFEAENAKREVDVIKNNRSADKVYHPSNSQNTPTMKWRFIPQDLPGFVRILIIIGVVFILAGFILAGFIPKPIDTGDPLSNSILQSSQNNLKATYIVGGFVVSFMCFIFAGIVYYLTIFQQAMLKGMAEGKSKPEIPLDVPNESFLRRFYRE